VDRINQHIQWAAEYGMLLDRQIGWFLAFENAPAIDTSLMVLEPRLLP
jgi:hypothetical protein